MLDIDKEALRNSTAAIRCKIIVKATDTLPEIILTDGFDIKENEYPSIKDWVYTDERYVPQQGFIGQFVARTLEGNLQNIDETFNIENREIELKLGILDLGSRYILITTENGIEIITENGNTIRLSQLTDADVNWYSLGNFIVTNPEDNEVNDNTKFEAMDYTKLFNQSFNPDFSNEVFTESYTTKLAFNEDGIPTGSVTALWLAQYTCAQVDVEFPQESFTNSDFKIDRNPFQANETCRDVMKEIGKIAFSWVRVDWDNKCYIDFGEGVEALADDEYNIIDNNQYYSLETKKNEYGPINKIYIGPSNIEGELVPVAEDTDSIKANGEHPLYIYDSSITYTPDLRELIANNGSANKLLGLSYTQLTTDTVGHPWFKGNEIITVVDMENKNHYTYPFNRTLNYSGHIKTTLDSMGETEVESTLAYESDIRKDLLNAKILVDKATGDITLWSERTKNIEDGMDDYYTKTDTEKLIANATEGLTNIYSSAGGNNKFRNTGLYFEEGSGFEYWEGTATKIIDTDSATQTAMVLSKGKFSQTITGIPNGTYKVSFKYKRLIESAIATVSINSQTYELGESDYFGSYKEGEVDANNNGLVNVSTNSLEIIFDCNIEGGYKIYELMGNVGETALVWTQHPDEIATDTVNISKGITITSNKSNAVFKANNDGIRIENKSNNTTTEFTERGMTTEEAEIKGQAKVTGVLFTRVGRQTWLNGL